MNGVVVMKKRFNLFLESSFRYDRDTPKNPQMSTRPLYYDSYVVFVRSSCKRFR